MAARTQAKIKRDIRRLLDLIRQYAEVRPALGYLKPFVESAHFNVERTWRTFQETAVDADRQRTERGDADDVLYNWEQRWRPNLLFTIPAAAQNIRKFPPSGATHDDLIAIVTDMKNLLEKDPGAAGLREAALADLGDKIEVARKETLEAAQALPAEAAARQAYAEATVHANEVLTRGLQVVRAEFGRKSPEYKRFITPGTAQEEAEDDRDSNIGEGGDDNDNE